MTNMRYIACLTATLLVCLDIVACKSASKLQESANKQLLAAESETAQAATAETSSPYNPSTNLNSPLQSEHPALTTIPEKSQDTRRLYVIRVVDSHSQAPVRKAEITVELSIPSGPKWAGLTDSHGIFDFEWEVVPQPVKAHLSIQAKGFASLDRHILLIPDRLIKLNRTN